jgi:hypothetical protein
MARSAKAAGLRERKHELIEGGKSKFVRIFYANPLASAQAWAELSVMSSIGVLAPIAPGSGAQRQEKFIKTSKRFTTEKFTIEGVPQAISSRGKFRCKL